MHDPRAEARRGAAPRGRPPARPEVRRQLLEHGRPISIGSNAWLGAGAIVLPGISIGEDSIVGAGSVVTLDVPAGVVAAGNPCRVVREL